MNTRLFVQEIFSLSHASEMSFITIARGISFIRDCAMIIRRRWGWDEKWASQGEILHNTPPPPPSYEAYAFWPDSYHYSLQYSRLFGRIPGKRGFAEKPLGFILSTFIWCCLGLIPLRQEPITRSLHLPYILESTFARIFLFLEQFSPQASLNSKESILYSALYCIVLCWVVLCCVVLYCIAYCARQSESPTVSKKDTRKGCLIGFLWEMEAPGDGLLSGI